MRKHGTRTLTACLSPMGFEVTIDSIDHPRKRYKPNRWRILEVQRIFDCVIGSGSYDYELDFGINYIDVTAYGL